MAFFFNNACKFSGCGLSFTSLAQLIEHIEETHIDTDPQFIEKQELQQPSAVAASYVISYLKGSKRFVTDAARHQHQDIPKKRPKPHSPGLNTSRSITPTGSEFDEEEIASESDSDNSWTTQEEYSSDLILRTMGTHMGDDKPFVCPVPGCKKRYKNVNGIKYHAKNGHRKENKIKKNFKCRCGKSYKTAQGLRQHVNHQHPPTALTPAQSPKPTQLVTTPSTTATQLATTRLTTTSIPAPLVTQSPMGITVQSPNVIVEPIAHVPNSNVLVEPGTPLTLVAPLTPTTPTAGFTIVTLPSQIEGATVNGNGNNQVTGAVVVTTTRGAEDGSLSALMP